MEVILLQKVANLGNIGDRVKVKPGYGRNFLLPQGKAALATRRTSRSSRSGAPSSRSGRPTISPPRVRGRPGSRASSLTITAKAGGEGKLFGSIGTADIAEALSADGIEVERSEVRLPGGPIRLVGEHHVKLHLHSDVEVDLTVTVVAEE